MKLYSYYRFSFYNSYQRQCKNIVKDDYILIDSIDPDASTLLILI